MTPLVSVCIFTYNHSKYIVQCVESVLMQNTSFPFEIIIGEDYSTDGARAICLNYADRYPEKIRMPDRGKNLGLCENYYTTLKEAKGKYIALLDGDDYWLDPLKLQKQFDYLEKEPAKNIVFHQVLRINEVKDTMDLFVKNVKNSYPYSDVLDKWLMATGAVFFRAAAMDYPGFLLHSPNFDLAIQMIVNRGGQESGYINEMMSVYRINAGSNTNNPAYDLENSARRQKLLYTEFNAWTNFVYDTQIQTKIREYDHHIQHSAGFQLKPIVTQVTKKILGKFGFRLVRVKPD